MFLWCDIAYSISRRAMTEQRYKCVLVGEPRSGKTAYMHKMLTGEFKEEYVPTIKLEQYTATVYTNHGDVTFDILECHETDSAQYVDADCAIYIYDIHANNECVIGSRWIDRLRASNPELPIMVIANFYEDKLCRIYEWSFPNIFSVFISTKFNDQILLYTTLRALVSKIRK